MVAFKVVYSFAIDEFFEADATFIVMGVCGFVEESGMFLDLTTDFDFGFCFILLILFENVAYNVINYICLYN